MAKEIERKFLVNKEEWLRSCHHRPCKYNQIGISQGYLFDILGHVGRIRITSDCKAKVTYKGPTKGITRTEVEFGVPYVIGKILEKFCGKVIHKTRTKAGIPGTNLVAEVDEFHNLSQELFLAEVELPSEDVVFIGPGWMGNEVSDNPFYYNSNLIRLVV